MKITDLDLQSVKAVKTMIEEEQLKFNNLTNQELKIALHCCNWLLELEDRMQRSYREVSKETEIKPTKPKKAKKVNDAPTKG